MNQACSLVQPDVGRRLSPLAKYGTKAFVTIHPGSFEIRLVCIESDVDEDVTGHIIKADQMPKDLADAYRLTINWAKYDATDLLDAPSGASLKPMCFSREGMEYAECMNTFETLMRYFVEGSNVDLDEVAFLLEKVHHLRFYVAH